MEQKFNDLFLEPSKYYEHGLKEEHAQTLNDYFDELVKKSGIDAEGNKQTAKEIEAQKVVLEGVNKKLKKAKTMKTVLLVLGIILFVAIIGIVLLVIRKNKYKNLVEDLRKQSDKEQAKLDELIAKSRAEIAPLTDLFTDYMSTELINKSAPFIEFNKCLSSEFLARMMEQFLYKEDHEPCNTTLVIQSGTMRNNPFLIRQYYHQSMVPHVYTGTLVITYTTMESNGNGGTRAVTHTQTLVATHTEDEPAYKVCSELVYCNDACPKLSFSREPTDLCNMNEKQIAKYIANYEKEDSKRAEKAIKKGGSYVKMTNSKFEAYWNSKGRNDEVGYRLMFTPLAQTNITHLFSLKEPYGDDVYYAKDGCVNTLCTRHSQSMDYSGGTYNYDADTFEEVQAKFINYNLSFFQGMMFDFMPIISIPIFHQNESAPFLGSEKTLSNVTKYEIEVMVNKGSMDIYKHEDSTTEVIVEAKKVTKSGKYDLVELVGHTFQAIPQVTIVPTLGADGKMHGVPVNYFIYEPLEKVVKAKAYTNITNIPANSSGNIVKYKEFALEIIE